MEPIPSFEKTARILEHILSFMPKEVSSTSSGPARRLRAPVRTKENLRALVRSRARPHLLFPAPQLGRTNPGLPAAARVLLEKGSLRFC